MATLSQQEQRKQRALQVFITPAAYKRIRVAAAKADVPPGRIVSDLAMDHLSPVEGEDDPDSEVSS